MSKAGRGKSQKNIELIAHCRRILEDIHPTTSRGVSYQLYIQKLIPDMSKKSTANVARLLVAARQEGMVPWEWIVDETRGVEGIATYEDVANFGERMMRGYRKDFWKRQSKWLIAVSEKATVSGVIRPILNRYAVDLLVMHGFGSATALHDLAKWSNSDDEKLLEILYIGDFDPSGMHMSEVDLPDRIERYGGVVEITRIALTRGDCTSSLPSFSLEEKKKDVRHDWFKRNYGDRCWELDAMNPNDLRDRLETEILRRIDEDTWSHCQMAETAERESYNRYLRAWPGIK